MTLGSVMSILEVEAGAEWAGFFGTFSNVASFPSYDSDFSDEARDLIDGEAATGYRLRVSPTLHMALGRLAVRSSRSVERWRLNGRGPCCYEPFRGTLIEGKGDTILAGSTLLLADLSEGQNRSLQLGVLHDIVHVPNAPQSRMQRLGPFLAKRLGRRRFGVREPVLYVAVLPYLEAPNRGGVAGLLALGFSGF